MFCSFLPRQKGAKVPTAIVAALVREIKNIARRGAIPECLATQRLLLSLAVVDPEIKDYRVQGPAIKKFLQDCIDCVDESVWFKGRELTAAEFRRAMEINLGMKEKISVSAKDRCIRTMQFLGFSYAYETWRKYQVALFRVLAAHILECSRTKPGI
jgi:hypothetical protein